MPPFLVLRNCQLPVLLLPNASFRGFAGCAHAIRQRIQGVFLPFVHLIFLGVPRCRLPVPPSLHQPRVMIVGLHPGKPLMEASSSHNRRVSKGLQIMEVSAFLCASSVSLLHSFVETLDMLWRQREPRREEATFPTFPKCPHLTFTSSAKGSMQCLNRRPC